VVLIHAPTSQTDGRTDGQTDDMRNLNTALCIGPIVHRAVKIYSINVSTIVYTIWTNDMA